MRRVLITSGGTKIPIDRVRHIANMSSGTFGSKIALETLKAGSHVDFFYAENSKTPFTFNANLISGDISNYLDSMNRLESIKDDIKNYGKNYSESTYKTFDEYHNKLESIIKNTKPDVIVLAAAVSDYGVENYVDGKIRSRHTSDMSINLVPLPKIISKVRQWHPNAYIVGFKLLVDSTKEELLEASKKSIEENDCDMIVGNDLRDIKENNHKLLISMRRKNKINTLEFSAADAPYNTYLAASVVNRFMYGCSCKSLDKQRNV